MVVRVKFVIKTVYRVNLVPIWSRGYAYWLWICSYALVDMQGGYAYAIRHMLLGNCGYGTYGYRRCI